MKSSHMLSWAFTQAAAASASAFVFSEEGYVVRRSKLESFGRYAATASAKASRSEVALRLMDSQDAYW